MRKFMVVVFAFLLPVGWATAEPPKLTVPAEVPGRVGDFVVVKATVTGSNWVKYKSVDAGLSVFPSDLLTDKMVTVVVATKPGRYKMWVYTGNTDGGADSLTTIVISQDGTTTPPVNPPPTDPVSPPADPAVKYHYIIVRPAGVGIPAELEAQIRKIIALPAWKEQSHTVADLPFTDLPPASQQAYTGRAMPFLVRAQWVGKHIFLPPDAPVLPLPTTDDDVRRLPK